jgi:molybdenum cofactor guanylyltransferase
MNTKKPSKIHIPILGVVLAGGEGRRMGEDKGALKYNDKDQVHHCVDLLSSICDRVYVSCRSAQKDLPHIHGLSTITDRYDWGPTGGIISAFEFNPQALWLALACDLPYMTVEALNELAHQHDPEMIATAFYNQEKNWAEPLCTLYTPRAYPVFKDYVTQGIKCPRRILALCAQAVKKVIPSDPHWIDNVNTPSERQVAINKISAATPPPRARV